MKRTTNSHLLALVQYWLDFKLTKAGKTAAICMCIAAISGMISLEIPSYQLVVAWAFFLFVSYGAAFLLRPRIEVHWQVPEKAVAGEAVEVTCRLSNRSTFWAHNLEAGIAWLPPSLRMTSNVKQIHTLAPDENGTLTFGLLPLKRGIHAWPNLLVSTTFPFGLFRIPARSPRKSDTRPHGRLVVYPAFHPLQNIDVPSNARYQPGGIALSSSIGESPEYIGNREYRTGDSLRHLDHRSWARLAEPTVREYQEEYYCRVALVLDTFVGKWRRVGPEGYPELEAAVSLSAAVADALGRGEYIIDLFAAGPELYVFRSGRHTAHLENVLELLACVDTCETNPFQRITPALADELASISSVVCVFLDWDADRALLVRSAVEAGCSVKVIIVRDSTTTLPYESSELSDMVTQYTPRTVQTGRIDIL